MYIGILTRAPIHYYGFLVAFVCVGWVSLGHFDKFVAALADFQNAFNQWVKEIFKLNNTIAENGNRDEKKEHTE